MNDIFRFHDACLTKSSNYFTFFEFYILQILQLKVNVIIDDY